MYAVYYYYLTVLFDRKFRSRYNAEEIIPNVFNDIITYLFYNIIFDQHDMLKVRINEYM